MTDEMPIKTFIPWFGAGRMIADQVGELLDGCSWVGIPFAGSLCETVAIKCRTVFANDLHRHVINLAQCIAQKQPELFRRLKRVCFHPDELKLAQNWCKVTNPAIPGPDVEAAANYFICGWLGRSSKSGTDDEFNGCTARRWNGNGGDSAIRFRNALRGLAAWSKLMRKFSFDCMDAFDFLKKCKDEPGHGLYVDPPWPDLGKDYRHNSIDHKRLRDVLCVFSCKVVVRYGDHPLVRELYENSDWFIQERYGRNQANDTQRELLITNWNPDRTLFT